MEEQLLKEAIDVLKQNKRPELIDCPVYGQYSSQNRTFIYSDSDECYSYKKLSPSNKTVRSSKAFAAIIKEELRRRENETGDKATVRLNLEGGCFIPDDNFGETVINFSRLNSQQWLMVQNGINRTYNHKTFLLFLQALKPSIEDFADVFRRMATLRMVGQTKITSNPIFTEDGQESGYRCTYRLEDGTDGEESFPSGFEVNVPFAKAGDKYYRIPIDLLFYRDENDELRIEVLCSEFENIEESAIIDEARFIQEETSELKQLLVLSDF